MTDKFLEYCKGKIFVIDCSDAGVDKNDRWCAIGETATIILNYISSYDRMLHPLANFKGYAEYLSGTNNNDVCFCLLSELDYNDISYLVDEIEYVETSGGADLTHQLYKHIMDKIREDNNGN